MAELVLPAKRMVESATASLNAWCNEHNMSSTSPIGIIQNQFNDALRFGHWGESPVRIAVLDKVDLALFLKYLVQMEMPGWSQLGLVVERDGLKVRLDAEPWSVPIGRVVTRDR